MTVIYRHPKSKIERNSPPKNFRSKDEITAAYEQVGKRTTKRNDWYKTINNIYSSDEC